MKTKIITSVLLGVLLIGIASAGLLDYFGKIDGSVTVLDPIIEYVLYDDFSSDILDDSLWEEVIATNLGEGMVDEHYILNGVYHTTQTTIGDRGTGLVFKDIIFEHGDSISYDINYISGEGNRISTMILNSNAYRWSFLGYWNEVNWDNNYGTHHIEIFFLNEGVYVILTHPGGTKDRHLYDEFPSETYTFGIVTRTGHNGLININYDNFYIGKLKK